MAVCERCSGSSMVYVSDEYVERVAGAPTLDEAHDAWLLRRARVANSVYPCPICNKAAFLLWDGGHYDPAHRRGDCADCIAHFGDPARRPR